ncbi:hypothetical protein EW093_16665 [Thiospirochaeta perfilievii]|uniref:Uncharacterized protein n=1 Tax=Thiospirochaeta perfilievii TaxID=252967 RepID=A0A5C1QFF6_9SPIO|nr:hypothetical protein [Thiospirochaeta perfilievii]QEN06251.1 hypothetical protein EW093_16665 [Thiospirochaeta perfilievii]
MLVKIECASESLFKEQYGDLIESLSENNINYEFVRDSIGFGEIQDYIIIGLVFVIESASSGLTFDILKGTILNCIKNISPDKKKNIYISIEDKTKNKTYDININYEKEDIKLEIPGDLKLHIKNK